MMVTPWLDVACAWRALGGEAECGDGHTVVCAEDRVLVAAIDGLGHGPAAARATEAAVEAIRGAPIELGLKELFARCHATLSRTRGVVMTVAVFEREGWMTWAGVGNVEGCLVRGAGGRERILAFGGILGHTPARVHVSRLPIAARDTLVLATDGIRSAFVADIAPWQTAQAQADHLLQSHSRPEDDALVLVARHVPAGS